MLELARLEDWEAVRRLSVQVHDLHAAWRPDLYEQCQAPYPKEKFLEDIQSRTVYVAKLGETVMGYTVLSVMAKSGPGIVSHKACALTAFVWRRMPEDRESAKLWWPISGHWPKLLAAGKCSWASIRKMMLPWRFIRNAAF